MFLSSLSLSPVRLFATPWTVPYQAPPSMGFSRQKYWSGLPFPSPGDLPNPGVEPGSPALQADATSEPVLPQKNSFLWACKHFSRLLLLFLCLVFTFLKCERHCDSVLGSLVFTCYIISHYQCALLLTQLWLPDVAPQPWSLSLDSVLNV